METSDSTEEIKQQDDILDIDINDVDEDDIIMVEQELSSEPKNSEGKINRDHFEIMNFLGEGSYAKVYKIKMKLTGEIFALK